MHYMLKLSAVTMSLLWVCVSILSVFHSCKGEIRHEYSSGDIIIGGLFPVHLKTNRSGTPGSRHCFDFDIKTFLHSQVMMYTIREINQRTPRFLPNITIGYDIYDTCSDVSLAIQATLQLLKTRSDNQSCGGFGLGEPETKAVVGESSSEKSIAVARIVTLSSVAQISYGASSELLSRKYNFPTFLRTVSSDAHQTKGIVELVHKFNWKAVAIVGSDDEYGRHGSERLSDHFSDKSVCIEFIEILPGYFNKDTTKSNQLLDKLVTRITYSSAEAIVLFTKGTNVEIIMGEAIKKKLNRTWIASDAWSTSIKIATLPGIELAGPVFGFTFHGQEVPGFKNYIETQLDRTRNSLMGDFLFCSDQSGNNSVEDCAQTNDQHQSKPCLDPRCLINFIDQDFSHSVYLAVKVIADSLRRLMKCDDQRCNRTSKFTASELLEKIKKTNCTVNNTLVSFDENGDPNLGYDIVYWNSSDNKSGKLMKVIGQYWPNGNIELPDHLVKTMTAVEVTAYNCFKTCKPGNELKMSLKRKCCGECATCEEETFSPGNGSECKRCDEKHYSVEGQRDKCYPVTEECLCWSCPFSIALNCFAVLGITITILFAILFTVYRETPIVKAVGGYLCLLELFSLLACFCLTFSFHGKPTRHSCRFGLPLFGVAFSLCISCILANLLQILVSFDFNLKVASWMKKINRPCAVVIVVPGVQLTLSVLWTIMEPSFPDELVILTQNFHTCRLKSEGFFAAMIGYLTFWAFVCFLFAYKGKKLPDLYKNATLISVSMLLFLIIWIIFIPLFLTMRGKNKAGVEVVSILISCYSILGFHLAPKCYIMLFRKELNDENAITGYIKKYYEQQGRAVIKS